MHYRNILRAAALFVPSLLGLSALPALSQTQTGVIPGFMAPAGTDGCPAANACFVPYSATYPLPVTGGGGGGGNVTVVGPLGSQTTAASVATTVNSSALPTGASTAANQTNASQKTQIVDGSGSVIGSTSNALNVDVVAGGAGGGAVYGPTAVGSAAANPPVLAGGTADGTATGNVGVLKIVSGVGSVNTAQVNGVATLTGTGATGTGAQRFTVAQDANTIAGSAVGTAGSASANVVSVQGIASGTNLPVSQGTASALNATVVGTGTFSVQNTAATPAGTNIVGKVGIDQTTPGTTNGVQVLSGSTTAVTQATASNLNAAVVGVGTAGSASGGILTVQGVASMTPVLVTPSAPADPCFASAKSFGDFESASSGGSIITAVSAKKAYVCSISIVTSAAANVSIVEGTGSSVCTGGTPAGDYLNTGTTAANGAAFIANGGVQAGGSMGTIFANATANQNTCVLFTTTNSPQVNVHVSYVQQ